MEESFLRMQEAKQQLLAAGDNATKTALSVRLASSDAIDGKTSSSSNSNSPSLSASSSEHIESIRTWNRVAGLIWRTCLGAKCTDDSSHVCEPGGFQNLTKRYESIAPNVRELMYKRRVNEIQQLLQHMYDAGESMVFFTTPLYYECDKWTVKGWAELAERLTVPTDYVAKILYDNFGWEVKIKYVTDLRRLIFQVPWLRVCEYEMIRYGVYTIKIDNEQTTTHVCLDRLLGNATNNAAPPHGVAHIPCRTVTDHSNCIYESPEGALWVCKNSGLVHACGHIFCDAKHFQNAKEGGACICLKTGAVFEVLPGESSTAQSFQTNDVQSKYTAREDVHWEPMRFKRFSRDRSSVTNITIDELRLQPNLFGSNFKELLELDRTSFNDMRTKRTEIKSPIMLHILEATKKIEALLSPQRIKQEFKHKLEVSNNDVASAMNQYDIRLTANQTYVDLLARYTIMVNTRNRRDNVLCGELDPIARHTLAETYATNAVILWWIIRTKTEMGRTRPKDFPFEPFIIAAVIHMTNGYMIDESEEIGRAPKRRKGNELVEHSEYLPNVTEATPKVCLIRQEPVLMMLNIATALEIYVATHGLTSNTNNPSSKNPTPVWTVGQGMGIHQKRKMGIKPIKTAQKNIEIALKTAVITEKVHPTLLTISNYTLASLTEDIFRENIKKITNRAKQE